MILNLENVKKYQSIIGSVSQVGNPVFGSIYLDFTNKVINFSNSDVFGEISIDVELAAGEQAPENIFVPASKLLHILKRQTSVVLTSDYTFKLDKDEIRLQHFSDTSYEFPEFDDTDAETIKLKNPEAISTYMKRALHYIDSNPDSPQSGVFFKKNSILATDSLSIYEWKSLEALPDLALPLELTRVFLSLPLKNDSEISFVKNDTAIKIVTDDFLLQMGLSVVLEVIDPTSDEYKALFDFEENVVCEHSELISEIEFLQAFYQDAPDERIKLSFSETELTISVEDYNQASVTVKIKEMTDVEYFEDQSIWLSGSSFLQALKDLPGEEVRIAFDIDLPPVDLSSSADAHVLMSRFEEG